VLELVATGTNGGAQEHVAALLSRLDRALFEVRVVALSDGSAVARWRSLGVPVEVISEHDEQRLVGILAGLLVDWDREVLHAHMFRAEVGGTRAALRVEEHGLPRPFVISHVHSGRRRSVADRAALRALTPSMDRLVAVSRSIEARLRVERPEGTPIQVIYNGVDLDRYDRTEACCTLPEEYGFPEGSPLVGCVARLEPEKGHRTLLEAWPLVLARVPDARLLIVGEGSLQEQLQAYADALGLLGDACEAGERVGTRGARPDARVVFTGHREDVPSVTAALDVAVLPSYREAQGLVILEAMALARPVVATRVGGIPEMIEDGVTGLLVPPRDAEALASAIVRLLMDHPLADTLARSGLVMARERFALEHMVRDISRLYEEGARAYAQRGPTARRRAVTPDGSAPGAASGTLLPPDHGSASPEQAVSQERTVPQ
jgi:glycosyltransferase involved in cell wall biosynthesis